MGRLRVSDWYGLDGDKAHLIPRVFGVDCDRRIAEHSFRTSSCNDDLLVCEIFGMR